MAAHEFCGPADVAARCDGAHYVGTEQAWRARCPAHQGDSTNSLKISSGRTGETLLKCFAGCALEAILDALSISTRALFPPRITDQNGSRTLVAAYDYYASDETLAYQVVRFEPKTFRQRRPDGHGGWTWNLNGVQPVLYRLPEVRAALRAGETIYLPEGEKDVDALRSLGLPATCNPGGAGKWRSEYSQALRGAHVVLLPDNDAPGRQHAQQVATSLHGVAATVRLVALPDLPDKGDVTDWLTAGGTRDTLKALADATPVWEPSAAQAAGASPDTLDLTPVVLPLNELLRRPIPPRTLWLPWLPERGITMAYGPRGVGKTQFGLSVALSLATGTDLFTWPAQPTDVLYVDGEMPLEDIRDRLIKLAGARHPQGLHLLASEVFYQSLGRDLRLTDGAIRTALDAYLEAHPAIRVIILDNISTLFTGISEDGKEDWEPINAWLIRLRHRGLSTLLMHHAGKSGQQRGTSSREDILDTVIALRRPADYDPQEGCRFHVHFTKARGVSGDAVQALDVTLLVTPTSQGEVWKWSAKPLEESHRDKVRDLLRDGESSTKLIAEEVGCSESYVRRIKRQFERGEMA